jgi:hypothetical protein
MWTEGQKDKQAGIKKLLVAFTFLANSPKICDHSGLHHCVS